MIKVKGIIVGLILVVLTSLYIVPVLAVSIDVIVNQINIRVNGQSVAKSGESITLNNGETVPSSILYKGTTYVPLSFLATVFDKDVQYDSSTQTAIINDKIQATPVPSTPIPLPTQEAIESGTKDRIKFDDYIKENDVNLTARDVQFNMNNNVGNLFILKGTAELDQYYNYQYIDAEPDYFCVSISTTDSYNKWFIYFYRNGYDKLFEYMKANNKIEIEVVAIIQPERYDENQLYMTASATSVYVPSTGLFIIEFPSVVPTQTPEPTSTPRPRATPRPTTAPRATISW